MKIDFWNWAHDGYTSPDEGWRLGPLLISKRVTQTSDGQHYPKIRYSVYERRPEDAPDNYGGAVVNGLTFTELIALLACQELPDGAPMPTIGIRVVQNEDIGSV